MTRKPLTNAPYKEMPKIIYLAVNFLRCKQESKKILRTINLGQFKVFQERYRTASPDPGYSKYLNIKIWLEKSLHNYYALDLHRSGPIKILDIGTGCGYFPFICNYYGHQSIALDLDEVPMYREITEFLRIDRRIWKVNPYERLPDVGAKFNLVTAFLVCFNNHDTPDVWGTKEWAFFLNDLAKNQVVTKGRVFLLLNEETDGRYYDKRLLSFFNNNGAKVCSNMIYFETMEAFLE